jgi:hypothetical protein
MNLSQEEIWPRHKWQELVQKSLALGASIDVSQIDYGIPHWPVDEATRPRILTPSYYSFLAGLICALDIHRIIEVGTHMGGSARAMVRGMNRPRGYEQHIYTVDVTDLSDSVLNSEPLITKIQGEACAGHVIQALVKLTAHQPIDLVFIDSQHEFQSTLDQFTTYQRLFTPKYILVDDVALNEPMREFWKIICARYPGKALDISKLAPGVRDPDCGFGLVTFV